MSEGRGDRKAGAAGRGGSPLEGRGDRKAGAAGRGGWPPDSRERARPRRDREADAAGGSGSRPGPVAVGSPRRGRSRAERLRAERERRRRHTTRGILVSLCIGAVVVAVFLGSRMWHSFGPQNDFAGNGKQDLVIEVHAGDSTTAIGETLHRRDVVRTVKVFLEAAQGNQAISKCNLVGASRCDLLVAARPRVKIQI